MAWKIRLDPLGLPKPGKSRRWSRVQRLNLRAIEALQRGTAPDPAPERVVPVAGAQAALDLCVRLLLDPGDPAWTEEPGYAGARAALLGAGARIEPVPVDAEGLDVAAGEARCPGARLAYITPSCQFPLGATLSLERRLRLLDWAETRPCHGAPVIRLRAVRTRTKQALPACGRCR